MTDKPLSAVLDEIEARLAQATKTPWCRGSDPNVIYGNCVVNKWGALESRTTVLHHLQHEWIGILNPSEDEQRANLDLIFAAIQALPQLIAAARERDALKELLRAALSTGDTAFSRAEQAEAAREKAEADAARLREATMDVLASLVAAISLLSRGSKKAAPSDKMFDQMLKDYEASASRARAALEGESK